MPGLSFPSRAGGAEEDEGHQARFMADAEAAVGKQFINADDGAVFVETETLDDGEGLVAKDALAHLQTDEGILGSTRQT